jgi:hypothetical protein
MREANAPSEEVDNTFAIASAYWQTGQEFTPAEGREDRSAIQRILNSARPIATAQRAVLGGKEGPSP